MKKRIIKTAAQGLDISDIFQKEGLAPLSAWEAGRLAGGIYDIADAVRQTIKTSMKPAHSLAGSIARSWLRSYRYFSKCAKFVYKDALVPLYHPEYNFSTQLDLLGHFDYTATLNSTYEVIIRVKVDDEPGPAGLELAADLLAAVRQKLVTPTCRLGLLRLKFDTYEYTDLTSEYDVSRLAVLALVDKYKTQGAK